MKQLIKAVASVICLAFILSGCSVLSFDNTDVMRPPKATGDKAAVQMAIESAVGDDYTLNYPQNGNYRSAIIMKDINGDRNNEAIALLKPAGENAEIHLMIMCEINSNWEVIGDFTSKSSEVDMVEFADLNGDGNLEILVGWTIFANNVNQLTAYFVAEDSVQEVSVNDTYSGFVVGDFSNNGKKDILLLSIGSAEAIASGKLLTCLDVDAPTLVIKASVDMNNDITRFESVQFGKISGKTFGAFIDGADSAENLCTQIVYLNTDTMELKNSHHLQIVDSKTTLRKEKVYSTDFDNDEIIEVPVVSRMAKEINESDDVVASIVDWCEFDVVSSLLTSNKTAVMNFDFNYSFAVVDKWKDNVTARIDKENDSIVFYSLNNNGNTVAKGDVLLTIRVFNSQSWIEQASKGNYTLIEKTEAYAYTYAMGDTKSNLLLTDEEIVSAFSLFK